MKTPAPTSAGIRRQIDWSGGTVTSRSSEANPRRPASTYGKPADSRLALEAYHNIVRRTANICAIARPAAEYGPGRVSMVEGVTDCDGEFDSACRRPDVRVFDFVVRVVIFGKASTRIAITRSRRLEVSNVESS
jgi:hypothetical protein